MYEALDGLNMLPHNYATPLNMVAPGTATNDQFQPPDNLRTSLSSKTLLQTKARVETTSPILKQLNPDKPATAEVIMENAPVTESAEVLQLAMVACGFFTAVNDDQLPEATAAVEANEERLPAPADERVNSPRPLAKPTEEQITPSLVVTEV